MSLTVLDNVYSKDRGLNKTRRNGRLKAFRLLKLIDAALLPLIYDCHKLIVRLPIKLKGEQTNAFAIVRQLNYALKTKSQLF